MKIKRIYHHIDKWEEAKTKMWSTLPKEQEDEYLKKAIEFTGNHKIYGKYMMKVIDNWKYSCEHNLSNVSINRQAWIGHSACAIAFDCPEYIVRKAWNYLTEDQRIKANKEADKAIKKWENNYKNYE